MNLNSSAWKLIWQIASYQRYSCLYVFSPQKHANCDQKVADLGEGSRGRILGKKRRRDGRASRSIIFSIFFIFIVDFWTCNIQLHRHLFSRISLAVKVINYCISIYKSHLYYWWKKQKVMLDKQLRSSKSTKQFRDSLYKPGLIDFASLLFPL